LRRVLDQRCPNTAQIEKLQIARPAKLWSGIDEYKLEWAMVSERRSALSMPRMPKPKTLSGTDRMHTLIPSSEGKPEQIQPLFFRAGLSIDQPWNSSILRTK
jgi:hypothetical protein